MKRSATLFSLLLIVAAIPLSQRHRSRQAIHGDPGVFDYYLLTLSWSPEFCYSHPDKPECQSGHHGFVVHGLWPQYVNGYPENCSTAPGPTHPEEMTDIMPDAGLVTHEWSAHGTCSGLDAKSYFQLLRRAYDSIKIPSRFENARQKFSIKPEDVKRDFVQANPKLTADEITVSCGNNYLTAVSLCMTKDLEPIACQNLRDCRANVIRVPRIP